MCEIRSEPATPARRIRELAFDAAIIIGTLLMLTGTICATFFNLSGEDGLATLWPCYLGGVVAIVLGWVNGDWRR
jgi:hypothetical protein